MRYNIGVIGYGIVGQAVAHGFSGKAQVLLYDKFQESDPLEQVIFESEFIFICVPTPVTDKGRIDLSAVNENVKEIDRLAADQDKIVIMKSSVVPGTTRKYSEVYPSLHWCCNPEFLTEANYLEDFINTDRIIIGADDPKTGWEVWNLYKSALPETQVFHTDLTTAEMVKYMANCFLATKVTFANEMFGLCEGLGICYEEVKALVVADSRIGKTHLDVTEERGFAGKCLPKDLDALLTRMNDLDVDAMLLRAVQEKNERLRKNATEEGKNV